MKEKKKIITMLVILIVIFIILLLSYLLKSNKKQEQQKILLEESTHISSYYSNNENTEGITAVKDRNDFFTVQSCINQYIVYLAQKDVDSLYNLLDKTYIQEFDITKENVLDYVESLSGEISFRAKKMYFEQINENVYRYYVKGEIIENDIDSMTSKGEFNITVNMDINNMLFSIIPYGHGGIFNEEV